MSEPRDFFDEEGEAQRPEIHLADYWAVLVEYKRLIIVCLLVALAAAVTLALVSPPSYRATVVLDINRQTSNPLGLSGSDSYDGNSGTDFVPSQIELLKSRDVAERVVRRLQLYANSDFNPAVAASFRPDNKGAIRQPSPQELASAAMTVKSKTQALGVRGTSLVQVSYVASTGRLAADVANALADSYIDWNIESRFRAIGRSAEFLAKQIVQTRRDIEEKEKQLLSFARQKDIVAVSPGSKLESVDRDYAVAVADRVSKEARDQELQGMAAEAIAESSASGFFAQLKAEQERLERDYTEKLNLYKPDWPAMQQLKHQIEQGRVRLQKAVQDTATRAREAAHADYLTALRREANLQGMLRAQQSEALSPGASDYNNLQSEIDTKKALLDTLLKQQGEAEVLSRLREQQFANVRVVDRALVPGRPFEPSVSRNVIVGLLGGLTLGIGLAFLLSYLDRSVRSTEQVEGELDLPALGAIPLLGKVKRLSGGRTLAGASSGPIELLPNLEPRSAVAEAYRVFRTSLLHSRAGGVRIITITSVLPQEGKSTTAVNLAVSLAQLGRRVLLVDADLHRSRLHTVFGVAESPGLVSILAEGIEPSRVIVKSSVTGVYLVPAGPETPNPSGLLSSDDMRKFLEIAAANFDHVVVDTPPLLATADVLVFGQHTDGVVLCLRAGQTQRDQARRVRDKLRRGGVPILGVLLNGVDVTSEYHGGYEYRHLNYGERSAAPLKRDSEAGGVSG